MNQTKTSKLIKVIETLVKLQNLKLHSIRLEIQDLLYQKDECASSLKTMLFDLEKQNQYKIEFNTYYLKHISSKIKNLEQKIHTIETTLNTKRINANKEYRINELYKKTLVKLNNENDKNQLKQELEDIDCLATIIYNYRF